MLQTFARYPTDTKHMCHPQADANELLPNKIWGIFMLMCLLVLFPFSSIAQSSGIDNTRLIKVSNGSSYQTITWPDLELPGHSVADIIKKYEAKVANLQDGDPAGLELLKNIQAELQNTPVNPALNGKRVKLPSYVAPLEIDQAKGMVGDFLLVPYVGACIHVPPPPSNQIILVKPQSGKSINLDKVNDAVWVSGIIEASSSKTDLAEAGYQILDANIEAYSPPEE